MTLPMAVLAEELTVTNSAGRRILDGLTVSISAGKRVLLVGPSGSGKSTLLRAIAGVPPTGELTFTGSLRVAGTDVLGRSMSQVERDTGWLPQDPAAAVCLPVVEDDVAFPCENRAVPRDRIDTLVTAALDRADAGRLRAFDTATLSDGQAQRVGLAAATAAEPAVLVLDEPTSMLDPVGLLAVHGAVRGLHRADGLPGAARGWHDPTLLLVEHRLDDLAGAVTLAGLPERTVALVDGRIVADGATEEVLFEAADLLHRNGCWLPWEAEVTALLSGTEVRSGQRNGAARLDRDAALATICRQMHPGAPVAPERLPGTRSSIGTRNSTPTSTSHSTGTGGTGTGGVSDTGSDRVRTRDRDREVLLAAAAVTVGYAAPILADVYLTLRAGELVAMVGANGSGKSTLLRTLAGLRKPMRGTLRLPGGRPGLVFQNPEHQFVASSVRQELAWGGADEVAVAEALRSHRLEQLADSSPFRLSGGEKRRLSLAAMLIGDRSVLLADEPMFGLDRRDTRDAQQALRQTAARQRAVLFSCHDLRVVAELATRLLVVADGRIVADGPTLPLLRDSALRHAAGLRLPPLLETLLGEFDDPTVRTVLATLAATALTGAGIPPTSDDSARPASVFDSSSAPFSARAR